VLGLLFYGVTQGAQVVAIDRQPAATTSLVLAMTPLAVAMTSRVAIGERATARQLGGTIAVIAGAATYFGGGLGATAFGMAAAVTALGGNTASKLVGRWVNRDRGQSAVVVTAVSMTVGAVVMAGGALVVEGPTTPSLRAGALLAWLAVINTALAFTLWNHALRRLTAVEAAGINNLMLIQIAALAWLFLDEHPTLGNVVGIIVVSIGVGLIQEIGGRRAGRATPLRCPGGPGR
jgi:drug/metabolite transporter (DMT)-like permease